MSEVFIATLRAVFSAQDEIEAIMVADQIKVNGEADLETDSGDTLDVTQVTQNLAQLSPEETVILLRKARNTLVRTRLREGYELASELDKFIFIIANRRENETGFELAGYKHTFLETAQEVLSGKNPIEY